MKKLLLFTVLLLGYHGYSQFGPQQTITTLVDYPRSICTIDIDNDGDLDVLSASSEDAKIAWYENMDGKGTFGPQQVITTSAAGAGCVYAADIDNDGDQDVLSASSSGEEFIVAWYENVDGIGTFSPQQIITDSAEGAASVYATDIDNDGDQDVLSASYVDNKIAWYENIDGNGTFGTQQIITTSAEAAVAVFAVDIDNDGDADVLSTSILDNKVAWYENTDGNGNFGPQQIITTSASGAVGLFAGDIDSDGDQDVLSTSIYDDKVAWYENIDGNGTFGPQRIISISLWAPASVYTADLDEDGDLDVLSAPHFGITVVWYENLDGQGTFGSDQIITYSASGVEKVIASDIDNDGDMDVLAASGGDDKIVWYGNGVYAIQPNDLEVCDDNNDGYAQFNLTNTIPEILGTQNPSEHTITFHLTQGYAENGINAINNPTNYVNVSNPQEIFARLENTNTNEFDITDFNLIVDFTPILYDITDYVLPEEDGNGHAVFDLTTKESELIGGQTDILLDYYETESDANTGNNPISNPEGYVNMSNPQTIYARLENSLTGCYAVNSFIIFAEPNMGFEELSKIDFIIWPNPVENELNISNVNGSVVIKWMMYDIFGRKVIENTEVTESIDLSNLTAGVYLIHINTDRGITTQKIIKE